MSVTQESTPKQQKTIKDIAKDPEDMNQEAAQKKLSELVFSLRILNMIVTDYRIKHDPDYAANQEKKSNQ